MVPNAFYVPFVIFSVCFIFFNFFFIFCVFFLLLVPTEHNHSDFDLLKYKQVMKVFLRNIAFDTLDVFKADREKDSPTEAELKVIVPCHMYKVRFIFHRLAI